MSDGRDRLGSIREQLEKGEEVRAPVRELLSWFGYSKRGRNVRRQIERELAKYDLVTVPAFDSVWLDREVQFRLATSVDIDVGGGKKLVDSGVGSVDVFDGVVAVASADPAYRIGKLPVANRAIHRVPPDADISSAVTVMLQHDFSQLPVMTSDRDVKGLITWRGIASHKAMGCDVTVVRDCMDPSVEIVTEDASLFTVIERVREHEVVLVRRADRMISGIVTAADLADIFDQLSRPFLLLSEIEWHLREVLRPLPPEKLAFGKSPSDPDAVVESVDDLAFGGYVALLGNEEIYKVLRLSLDRKILIKELDAIREVRNAVMHFDPEGVEEDDIDRLRNAVRFFDRLRAIRERMTL